MRHTTLIVLALAAFGCGGGDAGLGESCAEHGDCESAYQCINDVCVDRCQRSPDCGDGFACDDEGICRLSDGKPGDACHAETDCGPGLSCQIDNQNVDEENRLRASCTASFDTRPAGATCFDDGDCRNGTCALGHCVDLCSKTRDCASGNTCMLVPRVEAYGSLFGGCLPTSGNISWTIPSLAPNPAFLLPVPSEASFVSVVFEVDDSVLRVGATQVMAPSGTPVFLECDPNLNAPPETQCPARQYSNPVRHQPEPGLSVLAMPSNPEIELETGVYYVRGRTYRPGTNAPGSAIPRITALVRIGTGGPLDLHLHFLDLDDHPCKESFNNGTLDATIAANEEFFKQGFLEPLRAIFNTGGIQFGAITYHDITDKPDLDGLDVANAGALLSHGKDARGINVFFVRTLSPVGLQAFGPSPGPGRSREDTQVRHRDRPRHALLQDVARRRATHGARDRALHGPLSQRRGRRPVSRSDLRQ
jgi:hypothetical protein